MIRYDESECHDKLKSFKVAKIKTSLDTLMTRLAKIKRRLV